MELLNAGMSHSKATTSGLSHFLATAFTFQRIDSRKIADTQPMETNKQLVDLNGLSKQLKLSKRWLHEEAKSERIPSLKAGGKRVFNVDAVRNAIANQAAGQGGED